MKKLVFIMSMMFSIAAFSVCGQKVNIPASLTAAGGGSQDFCLVKISDYQSVVAANKSDLEKLVSEYNGKVSLCNGKCKDETDLKSSDDSDGAHCAGARTTIKVITNGDGSLSLGGAGAIKQ